MKLQRYINYTAIALIVLFVLSSCFTPKDNTDPEEGRSGLRLFTDHLTGCQYLGNPWGGITPRMDAQGNHLCEDTL